MQRFVKNLWIKVKISLFDFKPSVLLYKVQKRVGLTVHEVQLE